MIANPLRHAYNEFGKGKGDGQDQEAMVDPEAIFSQLFGGERFQDIIGTISLGTEMKSAMQDDEDEDEGEGVVAATTGPDGKPKLSPEQQAQVDRKKEAKRAAEEKVNAEKAKVREARVIDLVERLRTRLAIFTEQATSEDDQQIASGGKHTPHSARSDTAPTNAGRWSDLQSRPCGACTLRSSSRRATESSSSTLSGSYTSSSRSTTSPQRKPT